VTAAGEEREREDFRTQIRELLVIREDPTRVQAACRVPGLLNVFFSEAPGKIAQAKSICAECPIRELCLEGALKRREPCGVWGGELLRDGHVVTHRKRHPRHQQVRAQPISPVNTNRKA
jgi:WhiB family redox-sensing transcriptional regulator